MASPLFTKAIATFDKINGEDPNTVNIDGILFPAELFYAQRLSEWVEKIEPNASEALKLASRCQHIRRWEVPRSNFPEGRAGYLKWRSVLSVFHADIASLILKETGYDEKTIDRVRNIVLKKNREKDPDVQTMEDALCLVFLQFQAESFCAKHSDEKVIEILQKTWKKMSPKGCAEALRLSYSDSLNSLIKKSI